MNVVVVDVLRLDSRITSVFAVRMGIYRMSAVLGLACRLDGDDIVVESMHVPEQSQVSLLLRHINDYQLRETIGEKTAPVRDAILAAALLRITEQRDIE